ncbi:Signal recognition particle receptor subunit alpha-like protein [Lachnellula suecica]|uniref:Signal recognition particle receptor subunit alpha homolog n=1 Tax=Lachnellula suecica TaxID=602035 RepID=A0A8T9BXV0_9HELO|nr:Signal recognition particle receptor subunit alpha-like protein [Lachnellula suecica]
MLDTFEILTTSGVVLWSKSYSPISPAVINSLITNVFIEERTLPGARIADDISAANNPPYKYEQHTLKWTTVKELNLIFVAVYRSLLHLSWIDKLVDNIKTIFVDLYGDQLKKPNTTIVECHFDEYFDQQVKELEKNAINKDTRVAEASALEEAPISISGNLGDEPPPMPGVLSRGQSKNIFKDLTSNESTPIATPDTSRPSTPASHILTGKSGPGGKGSRRARKAANTPVYDSSGDESHKKGKPKASGPKKGRKWDAEGMADEDSDTPLDYSAPANGATSGEDESRPRTVEGVDQATWGSKTGKGQFVLKDLDDQVHLILASADAKKETSTAASTGVFGSSISAIGGLFRNVVGGKTLTKEDLDKAMKGMKDHLLKKNVAHEAAMRLCEGVERELIGGKTANFESVQAKIQTAMEASLQKILTPTSSLDLLREIDIVTSPSTLSLQKKRPYVISIVGVNGVGKSTNLSKICFFLLQNKYKVLVVACDTFRSGAVEQLAVHVRNLKELSAREGGEVELYQKGYGKDAANVAKDSVTFAAQEGFDVVLIDTAGRRHNDQRLMSSLEKFAKFANPDKILMVGEALVGTDSVAQARNFNTAFGAGRSLDGFIISKCDTVGDMVGTLVSMVHATNVPVLFVGVGQHYSDLRNLSVKWAVQKLLSSN